MSIKHRIDTGAIIIHGEKVLLVRYNNLNGQSFLVGPGGGVENDESIIQALVREVKEETGLEVNPSKILFIEDLLSRQIRFVKIWFLCKTIGGQLLKTQGAIDEGIIEASWYRKEELENEIVYPPILMNIDWHEFIEDNWEVKYLDLRYIDF